MIVVNLWMMLWIILTGEGGICGCARSAGGSEVPNNRVEIDKRFVRAVKATLGILITSMAMVVWNTVTINHYAVSITACLMALGTICGLALYAACLEAERTGKSLYERLTEAHRK